MFHKKNTSIDLYELAEFIGGDVKNAANGKVNDVSSLDALAVGVLACYHNSKYKHWLREATAGFCLLKPEDAELLPKGVTGIFSKTPYRAFGKAVAYFYPKEISNGKISELACAHPTAKIGKNCRIDAFAVIEAGAVIGDDSIIKSHSLIGANVKLGNACVIEPNVTITHTIAGDRLYVKPGARIGQRGFGFHMDENGHFDIPQVGRVLIGSDAQIGANATIDRGSQRDTIIGDFCRIDNLTQVAHNVELGDGCVLVAQSGIAGSSKLGKFVIAAGQAGISGHLNVGDGVRIAAQSGVARDVKPGETVAGSPAVPVRDWHKQTIALRELIKKPGR